MVKDFIGTTKDITAKKYPIRSAPLSPRNILAGYRLYIQKEKSAPDIISDKTITELTPKFIPITTIVIRAIIDTPEANPSRPSIRFMALVRKVTHKIDIIMPKPFILITPIPGIERDSTVIPPRNKINPTATSTSNFTHAEIGYRSSIRPIRKIIIDPRKMTGKYRPTSIKADGIDRLMPITIIQTAIKIATPPRKGVGFLWRLCRPG
jgi:hypothetical protein